MSRAPKVLLTVLLSLVGILVALVVATEVLLNSKAVSKAIDRIAAENLDASLSYSRAGASLFRDFPDISVSLDTLALVYPHDRWASFDSVSIGDSRLDAGRGASMDTLLRFDQLAARVNLWTLISGRIRVDDIHLHGLGLYAHSYSDSCANWMVFKAKKKAVKDSTSNTTTPWLQLDRISVAEGADIVYTSPRDSVFANLNCDHLLVSAGVKMRSGNLHVKDASVDFDALLDARKEPLGSFSIPLQLHADANLEQSGVSTEINLGALDANLAHIPLHAAGTGRIFADSTVVDMKASVDGCPLDTLLRDYADVVTIASRGLKTDARINLDAALKGVISENTIPSVEARLTIPRSGVEYSPYDVKGSMELDVEANSDSHRFVTASLKGLNVRIKGAEVEARGSADDLLGGDPRIRMGLAGFAKLDSLYSLFFTRKGMLVKGRVNLRLDADAHLSNFSAVSFPEASLKGQLRGDRIQFATDSMAVHAFNPDIELKSDRQGVHADVLMDSVHVANGTGLQARFRDMKNYAVLDKVKAENGRMVPHLELTTEDGRIYFRKDNMRAGVRNATITAAVHKRVELAQPQKKHTLAPREHDFSDKDIRFALDSTMQAMLKEWTSSLHVEAEKGFVSVPMLPLRTRISNLKADYDDDSIDLASLKVVSGTSDIAAKGNLKGLRGLESGKGYMRFDLLLTSNFINANELISAFQHGKTLDVDASKLTEDDESFVTDTLANAVPDKSKRSVIVVPRNMRGSLTMRFADVAYQDFKVKPFRSQVNVGGGVLQLTSTMANVTNVGRLDLSAYYATKSRNNISAAVDAKLSDVSASGLIHMLPMMDDMLPVLKSFEGNLNCEIAAKAALDTCMSPVMSSIEGMARFKGDKLHISDAGGLRTITGLLLFKDRNIGDITDLNVGALVRNNKVEIFPFELGVDRYRLALSGTQGFDGDMNYHISVMKSPLLIPFGINIYGKTDDWRFNIGPAKYRSCKVPDHTAETDTMKASVSKAIKDIMARKAPLSVH